MKTRQLKGYWVDESGLLEPGTLVVLCEGDRRLDEIGGDLTARRYRVTDSMTAVEITSTRGGWKFSPDEGECDRAGLAVNPMKEEPGLRPVPLNDLPVLPRA